MTDDVLMPAAIELAMATLEMERLRRARAESRAERNSHLCVLGDGVNYDLGCWVHYDDEKQIPRDEWCGNCLKRQDAHDRYMALGRPLGAARRKVSRLAKTMEDRLS